MKRKLSPLICSADQRHGDCVPSNHKVITGIKSRKCYAFHGTNYELRDAGFTLIEMIVAFTILSVSLVMVMQLFSAGLKASRASCDYTRAVIYAKDIMEEMSGAPVQKSGRFDDGYSWETDVQSYVEDEGTISNLLQIKIKIFWNDTLKNPKSLELVSLKALESKEEL